METKFNVGDKVKRNANYCGGTFRNTSAIYTVLSIYGDDVILKEIESTGSWNADRFELVQKGDGKPEDMTRYMVYGTGCDNKSSLYETEKSMKELLKECSKDRSWTGKIIGYKLVPLYEAKETTQLKTLTKVKKTVKKRIITKKAKKAKLGKK